MLTIIGSVLSAKRMLVLQWVFVPLFFMLSAVSAHAAEALNSPADAAPVAASPSLTEATTITPEGDAKLQAPTEAEASASTPESAVTKPQETITTAATSNLDFSPIALYHHADSVGKMVILLLLSGSVLSWSVWLSKTISILYYRRGLQTSAAQLCQSLTLEETRKLSSRVCRHIGEQALVELKNKQENGGRLIVETLKERVQARISRVEAGEARRLTRGVSILATTTAVAPFVGLFGTVWGIMHSFTSIARMQSTSLSVVAPGIAESLFATALGLAVAIPAVIFFNMLTRHISGARQQMMDVSTLTLCLLSQQLDEEQESSCQELAQQHDIKRVV
ncbi:MotA/TolQ/ExbB proton channel family protein [Pectobacterium cacticida]|uniref:MotA/TolQ/ExbB proton channel family protein n=1 Tax=Pectobacterium cacticida TaxID=69221 RepID=UPI002FF3D4BD